MARAGAASLDYNRRRFIGGSTAVGVTLWLGGCGTGSGPAPVAMPESLPVASIAPTPSPTAVPSDSPPPPLKNGVIVQAGDSIGYGSGAEDYAAVAHMGFGIGVAVYNDSVPGMTMVTGLSRVGNLVARYDPTRTSIFVLQQGTNDLSAGTDAITLYNAVAGPFLARMKNAGFYTVIGTILPRADGFWSQAKEAERTTYNGLVRGNSAGADVINDVAADIQLGDPNPNWKSYYPDALHPSFSGQQRLVTVYTALISPMLAWAPRSASLK